MKRHSWLFLSLSLAAAAIGYGRLPSETKQKMAGWFLNEAAIPIEVIQVKKKSISRAVHGAGKLQVVKETQVFSRVSGRVSDIRAKVGDSVREGQILATVHSPELLERLQSIEAAFEAAEQELRQKEAQLAAAEKNLDKAHELRNRDLIAGKDLSDAEAAADTGRAAQALAQSQVAHQQAELEQTRTLLSFAKLAAPISGVITDSSAGPGIHIQSSTAVFRIGSLDPLKVTIEVSPNDASSVGEGKLAQIRTEALPDDVFEGRVSVLRLKSELGQSVVAEIQVNNRDRRLAPGMRVQVTLAPTATRVVLLVPRPAIFEMAGKSSVYVVVNGRTQVRNVVKGGMVEDLLEIKSGVEDGESVVVSGLHLVKANSKVRAVPEKTF